jgi:intein-encoded DNA endonuclease-like protein
VPIYKKYNRDFFKIWSPDMAYILGFLFADGNIIKTKRHTHFMSVYTKDRPLLYLMRSLMGSDHKISKKISETGYCYKIQIGSKELFNDLVALGLIVNKAKRMKLPNIPNKYIGDFVRGYFDGDGNVWVGFLNKKRKTPTSVIQSSFTSCGKSFLEGLLFCLRKQGLLGGYIYKVKSKNCSRLSFSIRDSLKLAEIMYNRPHKLCLVRKKLVFEKFIKMRP